MKKKKCLLGLLVPSLLLAVAGCAREEVGGSGKENMPPDKIKLTATFENVQADDVTKMDISTSSGAFTWTEGDQIAVHTSTPNWQTATLESGAGLASGVFTALMNETDRDGYAIYPASVAGGTDTAPTITLPSEYTIDGSMGEYSPLPMIAVNAPNTALAFKHVGAIFRITLEDVPAETKYIKVTTDLDIYGTFTVQNPSTAAPTIETSSSTGKNVVKFTFSNALTQKQNIVLNVPIPVCKNTVYSTLSVDVYNASDVILAVAGNDKVRAMTRASGRKVSIAVVPNNERIGSFSILDKNVRIGKNGAAGAWTTLTYSAYDMTSPTPVAISDATITCIDNSNANVEWQVSGGTEIQVRAAANASAGEVATMTFRMAYCNDYKTATVTVTTVESATVTFRGFVISPGILKITAPNTFVLTDGTDPFVTLNLSSYDSFSASTYPRYYISWGELKDYWGSTGSGTSEVINQTDMSITTEGGSSSLWHVPTMEDYKTIIATTDTSRGAYVNDDTKSNGRKHYAKVYVDLTGSPYAGKGLSARSGTSPDYTYSTSVGSNYIAGLLLFPDDAEVVCENLTTFDTVDDRFTNDVTYNEIMALVNDGCLFLPCGGSGVISIYRSYYFAHGMDGNYNSASAGPLRDGERSYYGLGFKFDTVRVGMGSDLYLFTHLVQ